MTLQLLSDMFAEVPEPDKKATSLSAIFDEEPVPLDVFISDKRFLDNPPLSPLQFEAVQYIERIYNSPLYDGNIYQEMGEEFDPYWLQPIRNVNSITLQWGKGSGKDHICRVASLRVAYMLLCLKSPQRYYGLPDQDSIHLLNIASNSQQANRAFFKPMVQLVKKSPWFREHVDSPTRDTIQYAKHIEAVSGHSEAEGQEGLNLMLGVADEIDAFKAKDEMVGIGNRQREASTSAETILDMLKTSASTRFPASYKRIAISFPRYLGSTIQRLTAEAKEDNELYGADSKEYVSGPWATWEVNPLRTGKHEFIADYRKDPDGAAAKYECKPTRATDAYFRNMPTIRGAIDRATQPIEVLYNKVEKRSGVTGAVTPMWDVQFKFDPAFQPIQGALYAMHGDLALRGDRAGIAMSHVEKWLERPEIELNEDGSESEHIAVVPVIRNDFVIAFESKLNDTPPREIQMRWAKELAFALHKRGFQIGKFTFDGFQSADLMQQLEANGIETERVSTDLNENAWKTLRDVAYDYRLHMAHSDLLLRELEALSRVGNKVDHPPTGSKDLADAFACSIVGAIAVGGQEDPGGSVVEVGESLFEVGQLDMYLEGAGDVFPSGFLDMPIGFEKSMLSWH